MIICLILVILLALPLAMAGHAASPSLQPPRRGKIPERAREREKMPPPAERPSPDRRGPAGPPRDGPRRPPRPLPGRPWNGQTGEQRRDSSPLLPGSQSTRELRFRVPGRKLSPLRQPWQQHDASPLWPASTASDSSASFRSTRGWSCHAWYVCLLDPSPFTSLS